MSRTFQLTLAVALFGFCASAGVQRQAVFAQDNPRIMHRGPIFRAEPKPATTEAPKPTPAPLNCAIREDGSYLPEGLQCSRLYYTCSHGVSRFHWCPSNTVFSTDKAACDFYDNVKECPKIPKLTPKPTTPKPTTTQRPGATSSQPATTPRPSNNGNSWQPTTTPRPSNNGNSSQPTF